MPDETANQEQQQATQSAEFELTPELLFDPSTSDRLSLRALTRLVSIDSSPDDIGTSVDRDMIVQRSYNYAMSEVYNAIAVIARRLGGGDASETS